jgi:hypothetical protein
MLKESTKINLYENSGVGKLKCWKCIDCTRFEVFMAVTIKNITIFWDVMPCSLVEVY